MCAERLLRLPRRRQFRQPVEERLLPSAPGPASSANRARRLLCRLVPVRRAKRGKIAERDLRHRLVRQPGAGLGDPGLFDVASVIAAIWSALRSSTSNTASHIASVGARMAYWICENAGVMLSAVACPAIGMNSFSVQLPLCGSIDSFIIFEFMYIMHTASIAPGARAGVGVRDRAAVRRCSATSPDADIQTYRCGSSTARCWSPRSSRWSAPETSADGS